MNINLATGMNEIIIREGAAPKVLDPKAPVKMNINGTIGAPVEFLKKRINAGQFRPSGQFQLAGIVHAFNPCFQGWRQGELGGGNIRQD